MYPILEVIELLFATIQCCESLQFWIGQTACHLLLRTSFHVDLRLLVADRDHTIRLFLFSILVIIGHCSSLFETPSLGTWWLGICARNQVLERSNPDRHSYFMHSTARFVLWVIHGARAVARQNSSDWLLEDALAQDFRQFFQIFNGFWWIILTIQAHPLYRLLAC